MLESMYYEKKEEKRVGNMGSWCNIFKMMARKDLSIFFLQFSFFDM